MSHPVETRYRLLTGTGRRRQEKNMIAVGRRVTILSCRPIPSRILPSTVSNFGCEMVASEGMVRRLTEGFPCKRMVGARGFEPRTSSLSGSHISLSIETQ